MLFGLRLAGRDATGLCWTGRPRPPGARPRRRKPSPLSWLARHGIARLRSTPPGRTVDAVARPKPVPVVIAAGLTAAAGPVAIARSQISESGRAGSRAGTLRLVARPVSPAAGFSRTRLFSQVATPGGPTVPVFRARFRGALRARPRADIPLQVETRRAGPGRELTGTTVGLLKRVRRLSTMFLAAGLQVCAFTRHLAAANLSRPAAACVPVGRGQRIRPDALPAEFAQPVLGVVLVVAPVVWGRAIIPPPAH